MYGLVAILSLPKQNKIHEKERPFSERENRFTEKSLENLGLDYEGATGGYLQEIFFHAPLAIANALNARGDYAEAREWFHYIFDPFAKTTGDSSEDEKISPSWRYRYFRELAKKKNR